MSTVCQYPYVNVFKQFGVGQWKKCCKEGDVTPVMDRDVKATVYRISGAILSSNYIQIPKAASQSLGLSGRFLYLLFRPLPTKYFSIHLELATQTGLAVRVSLSNVFKEFKCTSTWLQFPFSFLDSGAEKENVRGGGGGGGGGREKPGGPRFSQTHRWTLLILDLRAMLTDHLNTKFAYIKNIKLCANLKVKGVFTSDTEYSPFADSSAQQSGGVQPLPREMSFPLGKSETFSEVYDFMRFPSETTGVCCERGRSEKLGGQQRKGVTAGGRSTVGFVSVEGDGGRSGRRSPNRSKGGARSARPMKDGSGMGEEGERGGEGVRGGKGGRETRGVHVYAERGAEVNLLRDSREEGEEGDNFRDKREREATSRGGVHVPAVQSETSNLQSLQPDPIMRLHRVIGCGGHCTSQVLFPTGRGGGNVVYPCHSLVVIADLESGQQRFLSGHTAKVSCLAVSDDGSMLASGQAGGCASVRVWDYESGQCLALFQTHSHSLSSLSLSSPGGVLCGVGRDRHSKSHVVLWSTASLRPLSGEVTVLAQAHTDVSVHTMKIAHFDERRMVSCGRDNIRFWRVKGGTLRSCPVSLEGHHQMQFSDVAFQPGYPNGGDITDRNVYACTRSGHMFEIHYKSISLRRVWHLLPGNGSEAGGVALTSLCLHEAFGVTGSEDGLVRVWPSDFSAVFLEAEHEASVTAVGISEDGMRILAATASGNIGILDAGSRSYATVMRSHTERVRGVCLDSRGQQLVTCSSDNTIRVWDTASGEQLFDFRSVSEAPLCVSHHPEQQVFACGFSSGAVRVFHTPTTAVLAEHRQHPGAVRSVLFSPSGYRLYTSYSAGTLAMFDSEQQSCPLLRLLGNAVVRGEEFGPQALAISEDGQRLAYVGPLQCTVTVLDALSLNEVLRLDITPMAPPLSPTHSVSSAQLIMFSPRSVDHLLVVGSPLSSGERGGSRLMKFSASTGQLLSEVSHIHRGECTALCLSPSGRYIVTAGDNSVKIWDYSMSLDLNFQVFTGHSEPISQLLVTPDGRRVISCGDAIFLWDFLAPPHPPLPPPPSSPTVPIQRNASMLSVSPRVGPPAPTNYEPLKSHMFTPLPAGAAAKEKRIRVATSHEATIDDDDHHAYHKHSDCSEENRGDGGTGREGEGVRFEQREEVMEDSTSESETGDGDGEGDGDGDGDGDGMQEEQGDGEIFIEHAPHEDIKIEKESQEGETPRSVTVAKHYRPCPPSVSLAAHLYMAPADQAGVVRRAVLGVSGRGRGNVVWQASSGLFAYSSGCIVVVEDLSNGHQTHLTGHSEEVSTLAAMGDGQVLASSSHAHNSTPCEIRIWKLTTKKCSKVLTFHAHAVTSMAYSRDDRFLLSLGDYHDNSLAVWSTYDYSVVAATTTSLACHELRWDPFTAYEFVTVGAEMSVCFWMLEESTEKCELKVHEAEVPSDLLQGKKKSDVDFTAVCYGHSSQLFIGSSAGVVSMWNTSQNKCIMFWKTDPCEIGAVWYSNGRLAVGSVSGRLVVWGVGGEGSPPTVSQENELELDGAVFSLAFDHQMKLGVASTASGVVWYINWAEQSKVRLVSGHTGQVTGAATTRDGLQLATCCKGGTVAVWGLDSLDQTVVFQTPKKECLCVAFSPTTITTTTTNASSNEEGHPLHHCSHLLAAGYSDGSVRVFNTASAQAERKMQPHASPVTKIAFSTDGCVLLSGCVDGVIAVSNVSCGLVVRVISDHQGAPITDLCAAREPVQIPSLGVEGVWLWLVASGDRRVSVWSAEWSQDVCHLLDWLTFPGPACAPDGTRLRRGHKCQYELLPPSLARFSPSDPDIILYTGYGLEKCVQFYSISQKTVLRTYALTHWATCMDISPLGHLITLGCSERVLKLMDYAEGSFQDFSGHQDSISTVLFSLSGKSLISTSDSVVHVWNVLH